MPCSPLHLLPTAGFYLLVIKCIMLSLFSARKLKCYLKTKGLNQYISPLFIYPISDHCKKTFFHLKNVCVANSFGR